MSEGGTAAESLANATETGLGDGETVREPGDTANPPDDGAEARETPAEEEQFKAWVEEIAGRAAEEAAQRVLAGMAGTAGKEGPPTMTDTHTATGDNAFSAAAAAAKNAGPAEPIMTPWGPLHPGLACFIPVVEHWLPKLIHSGFIGRITRNSARETDAWKSILTDEKIQRQVTHLLRQKLGTAKADAFIAQMVNGT